MDNRRPRAGRLAARHSLASLPLSAIALGLALAGTAAPPLVHAADAGQAAPARKAYAISTGALGAALAEFASQAGVTVQADSRVVEGLNTPGIRGSFTVREGFAALLSGTGLEAADAGAGVFLVRRLPAASATGPVSRLQAISVTANGESDGLPPAYAGGQVARGGRLGMLGDRDVMDAPFSIASYTSELIQNRQAATMADLLDNDPAVRVSSRGRNTSVGGGDNFSLRGFGLTNRDISLNGLYGVMPYGTLSLEMVERVEVLKGPSALLGGMAPSGGVGGAINVVPKRATDAPITRFTASYASDSQWGGHLDLGRRWGERNEFGLRFNGVYRDGDTAVSSQSAKLAAAAIGLDYRGDRLRVSLDAGHQTDDARGASVGYRLAPALTALPSAPRPDVRLAQSWERRKYEDNYFALQAEYDLSPALTAYAALGGRNHKHSNLRTVSRILDASGNFGAEPTNYPEFADTRSFLAGVRLKFQALSARHEINLSTTSLRTEGGFGFARWAPFMSNLNDPVVIDDPTQTSPVDGFLDPRKAFRSRATSVGISDTMGWFDDALQLTLGLRRQSFGQDSYDTSVPETPLIPGEKKSVTTPALGVVFRPWETTAFYANYIEGLSPGATAPADAENANEVFPPVRTKQKELGVKADFGSVIATAALFEIKQPNVISVAGSVPGRDRYLLDGEQRSRGLEFSVMGEPTRGLRVLAGAAYIQAKQVRTQNGANDGKEATASPRWIANAGVEWDAPFLSGLALNTRVLLTGAQYVNAANTQRLPGWARWDIGARYQTRGFGHPVTLRANILNVANRGYWEASGGSAGILLAAPRMVYLSATIDF